MNDSERRRKLNRVELVAGQANTHLSATLSALRDGMRGQPKAQSYDTASGPGEVWCWTHQGPAKGKDGCGCDGETIRTNDPTGEQALLPDPAQADLDRLDRALKAMETHAETIVDVFKKWRTPTREQGEQLAEAFAKLLEDGEPACEVCARHGHWSAQRVSASDCAGNLPRPYSLCDWCYRFVRSYGRLPTKAEVDQHHTTGTRVRVKA